MRPRTISSRKSRKCRKNWTNWSSYSHGYPWRWCIFDVAGREKEIAELEKQAAQPDIWADRAKAQETMRQLAEQKKVVQKWREMEKALADIAELIPLAGEDPSLEPDIRADLGRAASRLDEMEMEVAFRSPYDSHNALLAIHAGAGGTESQDWAEMLMRMYLRWAERRGYETEILDVSPGEEAGIKSVTISVKGSYATGYLKSEHGVHRLVRLSPFDADHARHTSFALVEVMPEAEGDVDVKIDPADLKIDVFRSSGPGGQHMQKTSSAVRIVHIPTGTTVSCQNERSQYQNKEVAMKILRSRLLKLELARREEERARLKGKHVEAGWGNQIRSYVLHPYKMVKDHRTDHETGNAEAVLEGDLDSFIQAYLRSTMGREQ